MCIGRLRGEVPLTWREVQDDTQMRSLVHRAGLLHGTVAQTGKATKSEALSEVHSTSGHTSDTESVVRAKWWFGTESRQAETLSNYVWWAHATDDRVDIHLLCIGMQEMSAKNATVLYKC